MMFRLLLSACVLCVITTAAQGVLIEIAFSMTGGGIGEGAAADGLVVFDTEKSPDFVFTSSVVFLPESGAVYFGSSKQGGATPFSDDSGLEFDPTAMTYGELTYYSNSDRFTITLSNNGVDIFFTVDAPSSGFDLGMSSLPDSPGDYAFAGTTGDFVSSFVSVPASGSFSESSWSPTAGYSGRVWYNVRVVEVEPVGCSAADMNQDGSLDFFDVSEFLTIFGAGCLP